MIFLRSRHQISLFLFLFVIGSPAVFYFLIRPKSGDYLMLQYVLDDVNYNVSLNEKYFIREEPISLPDYNEWNGNVPFEYFDFLAGKKSPNINDSCALISTTFDLKFNNIFWQIFPTDFGDYYIFNAYYDNRTLVAHKPIIRILTMLDRIEPKHKLFCQIWSRKYSKPFISEVYEIRYIWEKAWGHIDKIQHTYLLSCKLPKEFTHEIPDSVSLVEHECDKATNNIRIIYNLPKKQKEKFAVCVKGLDFINPEFGKRLIEWLEILLLLGADKVILYDLILNEEIRKILQYYEKNNKVSLPKFTYPGEEPNLPKAQHLYNIFKLYNRMHIELVSYNDCFYQNMYLYEYIILLDIDEVIMPKNASNWFELFDQLKIMSSKERDFSEWTSFNAKNIYFLDDMTSKADLEGIPTYMHILGHTKRSSITTPPGFYIKCFHNTERVLTLHNHYPFSCVEGYCHSFNIPSETALMQHYRSNCSPEVNCTEYRSNTIKDPGILKYKHALLSNVQKVLDDLHL